jgi:hypothetical protein
MMRTSFRSRAAALSAIALSASALAYAESDFYLRLFEPEASRVSSELPEGVSLAGASIKVGDVFDVYEERLVAEDGEAAYKGFVDSIYVKGFAKDGMPEFGYTWEGQRKHLAIGYVAIPAGRRYLVGAERFQDLPSGGAPLAKAPEARSEKASAAAAAIGTGQAATGGGMTISISSGVGGNAMKESANSSDALMLVAAVELSFGNIGIEALLSAPFYDGSELIGAILFKYRSALNGLFTLEFGAGFDALGMASPSDSPLSAAVTTMSAQLRILDIGTLGYKMDIKAGGFVKGFAGVAGTFIVPFAALVISF